MAISRRVTLQAILSVVPLLAKGATISYEVRLGYDSL